MAALRAAAEHHGVAPGELSRDAYTTTPSDVRGGLGAVGVLRALGVDGWAGVRAVLSAEGAAPAPRPRPAPHPASPPPPDFDDDETAPDEVPLPALPERHVVRGVSTLVGPDGEVRAQWVKTRAEDVTRAEVLERLVAELPERVPTRAEVAPPPDGELADDLMAVYAMGDPHVGMLAWAPEAGEHFDLDICRRLMEGAIDRLTQDGPRTRRALICQLGDFFHSDLPTNRTPQSGHALDVDGRWFRVLQVGIGIMVHTVDAALAAHERVDVVCLSGNHDEITSLFLSVALAEHYRLDPRVHVDMSPSMYRYLRWGRVLLGMTHGHTVRHHELESIMAADRAADWGETRHRYWYVGHIHHSTRKELRGCTVESFRTLAAKDAWHAASGYRSTRDMTRIVLHREWGEVSRSVVSAEALMRRAEEHG